FLTALIWSCRDYGISKINANINGNIFKIDKDTSINTVIESTKIYEINKQTIYYLSNEEILPITYYHDDDKLAFLINKLANRYENTSFDFELVEDFLIISISDEHEVLSKTIINLL